MNRTESIVSAVVTLVVTIAGLFGCNLSTDVVTSIVSITAVVVAFVYAIWKNHNFTDAAITAQGVLNDLKQSELDEELESE